MNPFQKNPFVKGNNAHIVGYNKQFDEKQKLDGIRESMAKLKFQQPVNEPKVFQESSLGVKDKVDLLKRINRD